MLFAFMHSRCYIDKAKVMLALLSFFSHFHGFGVSSVGNVEQQSYKYFGSQLLKVRRCPEFYTILNEDDLDVWSANATHVDVFVPANRVNLFKLELSKHLVRYEVMIEDIYKLIKQNDSPTLFRTVDKINYRMNWENYHRLDVIHEYLDYLAANFPKTVTVDIMGYSGEGRPLKYAKVFSDNGTSKAVFIDGGIHAREWISPASVTFILKELVENRSRQPPEILALEVYVLPVLNPDGYEYSFTTDRLWRKNRSGEGACLGTDLNRNFDFHWASQGSSANHCSEVYMGVAPASEPETKAISTFLDKLKVKVKAYVTFHSYGQYILFPFGYDYNSLAPDYKELISVGEFAAGRIFNASGAIYRVGNTAQMLYAASGGSDDWAKGVAGIKYTYTIELRDLGQYSFLLPVEEIIPTALDAFEAFKAVASAAYLLK